MFLNMHSPHTPRKAHEQTIAVAAILWLMVAGVCVVIANAWAMGI